MSRGWSKRTGILAAGLACLAATAAGQSLPRVAPERGGFSSARLERLGSYLDQVVKDSQTAGVVAIVVHDGKVVYEHASGMADREASRPMTVDALFRIASQTKAITSVAAMILIEEGVMALSDPITKWLPTYARMQVSVADTSGAGRRLEPLVRPITVRDLLTHSAGISYGRESWLDSAYAANGLGSGAGAGWYFAHKSTPICEALEPLAALPLAAQPRSRWVYGYATDLLGCLVERATGTSLAEFVARRITGPLGMPDTYFCVPTSAQPRLTAVYSRNRESLTRAPDGPLGQGDYVAGPCRAYSGGAGLVSTAEDYARFLLMMANGGILDGARVLAPATVALMTRDHVGELYGGPEVGFGLGFEVWSDPARGGRFGEPGQYGWAGAYHTVFWVDPASNLVAVFMTQLMPATGSTLHERFRTMVYQAMLDP
jgi:CubicO group peptidase (beta-lactamase class C family)